MKAYYLAVFVLAILQPQSGWFLLPTIPVALAASKKENDESVFLLAFLAGILIDLFVGTLLGTTAIFLLFEALLIERLGSFFRNSLRLTLLVGLLFGFLFQVIFRGWLRI